MILYNDYLRSKYGCKVYRIAVDAGFRCPGRCSYCNENGSRSPYTDPKQTVEEQVRKRIEYLKDKKRAAKFIIYFQAFTNTNASAKKLKEIYDKALGFDGIVGLSIGTRPDAVDREKIELISSYKNRYEVWIEFGLQSSNDETLKNIGRGHSYADFARAVKLAKEYGILVSAHVILGLPGETKKDMMATAEKLNELKIDGVKVHPLHILRGSALETPYREGKLKLLAEDEYVELAREFIKRLPDDVIIQRMTGQGGKLDHIAPAWALNKLNTIEKMRKCLAHR
jgi:radical SAM protein (TIGR01212 family)